MRVCALADLANGLTVAVADHAAVATVSLTGVAMPATAAHATAVAGPHRFVVDVAGPERRARSGAYVRGIIHTTARDARNPKRGDDRLNDFAQRVDHEQLQARFGGAAGLVHATTSRDGPEAAS